jgi:chromate reductase, NAD(P)H dehydrogenase (quinone)
MMRILAISGSLRAASINTALMNAAAILAPENVEVIVCGRLGELPHFNPDLDRKPVPLAVAGFRYQLRESAGVIISSPEYAHGVPGVLKNALDWLVASGELYEKPVALFSASPRATYAQASLTETLNVMMAKVPVASSITLPVQGKGLDARGIASDADASSRVRLALVTFAHSIERAAGMDLPDSRDGGQPAALLQNLS